MINLTIPLYPYMPSGNVYPWESPFITEDIASYERNDARLFYISMGSEMGTRLMGPAFFDENKTRVHEISLEKLLNRSARVVSIPKPAGGAISKDDLAIALDKLGDFNQGDAVIIVTGWGESKRWKELGDRYVIDSPFFTPEAAAHLSEFMQTQQTDLLMTDCLYLDSFIDKSKIGEWLRISEWLRLPYPSDHSKSFIRNYSKQEYMDAWKSTRILVEKNWVVLGLSGCDQLVDDRIQINCLPLFIDDVGQAPCTVVANSI